MDNKELAYKDWLKGMKYKEIAEKYNVSLSAVKSWASRDWKSKGHDRKVATKPKKLQPKIEKVATKRGAPKGNTNAIGNKGGAPKGSQNALKHGGYVNRYSNNYWDFLEADELDMVQTLETDIEQLLEEQILFYSVRERYLIKIIREQKTKAGMNGLIVSSIVRSEDKIDFKGKEHELPEYEQIVIKKQEEEKISYFGNHYQLQTSTENVLKIIKDLEGELTRVNRAKTSAIVELNKIRSAREQNGESKNAVIDDWVNSFTVGEQNE